MFSTPGLRRLPLSFVPLLFLFAIPPAGGVEIVGSLSNFDVMQSGLPVADNFELEFYGPVASGDFYDYYHGWGIVPRFDRIGPLGGPMGTEVMWLDRAQPILNGQVVHFGLDFNPTLPPMPVKAWYTHVIKERQIPVPFQWWWTDGANVVDVLTLSPTYPTPLMIRRDYAVTTAPVPLEDLQYDTTPVVWSFFDVFLIAPGDVNFDLMLPYMPGQSYLVRYTVESPDYPGMALTRFVTEAVPGTMVPGFEEVLVSFDLFNWLPETEFDNVELDFFGSWCHPDQVRRWYRTEATPLVPAWGVAPLVRRFPTGFFPEMPDRPGFEVTWVDKFETFGSGEMFQFGLAFDPGVMGPMPTEWTWVQGYWTSIEKSPVPVPWQFWRELPASIIDIITYGGDEVGPVLINREWVTLPERLPLEMLTWDQVDPLPWNPVSGDPMVWMPGMMGELEIPVGVGDRAALVRYTVQPLMGPGMTRVINEAMIDAFSGIEAVPEQGRSYLAPARPNPSAGGAEIRFETAAPGPAQLLIVDATGRLVTTLFDGQLGAGPHTLVWDGRAADGSAAASGVYFYALKTGDRTITQRLVLEK